MRLAGLKTHDGRWIARRVWIACSFKHRLLGLLRTESLAQDEALMLSPGGSIHTLGMRYPIDVAFLDRQLKILRLSPQLPPWRICYAPRKTKHVVELRAGMVQALQLQVNTFMCMESQEHQASSVHGERRISSCNSAVRFSLRLPVRTDRRNSSSCVQTDRHESSASEDTDF
jgi:uncharacterized membrane protein (UPF0127 family)